MAKDKTFEELVAEELKKDDNNQEEEIEQAVDELEDEEFDEVDEQPEEIEPPEKTYNKHEVESITKARVKNYSKKLDRMGKYKDALDTLADITGLEADSLADTLLNMTPAQQAKMLNIPVEQISGTVSQRKQARMTKKEQIETKRQLKYLDLEKKDGYEDLPILREDIEALLDTNANLSYEEAYVLVKAELKPEDKPKPNPTKTRRVISDDDVGGARNTSNKRISPAIRRAAQMANMDPKEYIAYSKMGNIDDYYKYKNAKAKG